MVSSICGVYGIYGWARDRSRGVVAKGLDGVLEGERVGWVISGRV